MRERGSVKSQSDQALGRSAVNRRFSVAPMLDWTDRHCRYFLRLMSKHTLLYTEMVTTGAIIYGKGDYLGYNKDCLLYTSDAADE